MSPPAKRRRLSEEPEQEQQPVPSASESDNKDEHANESVAIETTQTGILTPLQDRAARFAALKKRATQSARSNLAESKAEAQRSAIDQTALASLARRKDIAEHKLLEAEIESEGGKGAFERKRAWDYTIEESQKWDERLARKREAREKNSFNDYSAEAAKIYERQIRELEKEAAKNGGGDRADYEAKKQNLIEQAAKSGALEIVEMADGELVAIDTEGRFYANGDGAAFSEKKPKKENIDRLVGDLQKAEEVRLKKRKDRSGRGEDGDVTFINEKNKQFNMKLARFYDRYTTDVRDSFERGTAI